MPAYILDFVVNQVQVQSSCPEIKTPVSILVLANGISQPFQTPEIAFSDDMRFNSGCRLILSLPDLNNAYIIVKLCTTNKGQQVILAHSQVALTKFPSGQANRISFPLKNVSNPYQDAVIITLTAALSMLQPQHQSHGGYQPQNPRPSVYNGPNAPFPTQTFNSYSSQYPTYPQIHPRNPYNTQPPPRQYPSWGQPSYFSYPPQNQSMNYPSFPPGNYPQ